jgi:hypothetical protein
MHNLVPKPFPLKAASLAISDSMIASDLKNEIEQSTDWDKPPVHSTHALHQDLEAVIDFSIRHKSFGEMRVHDTSTPFVSQPFLVAFPYHRAE